MALITSPAARLGLTTVLMSLLFVVSHGYGGLIGGRRPVENVKTNKQVHELGRFSVEEYNRMRRQSLRSSGGGELQFREVVEAETQVVSGIKYYLKISTVRSGLNGGTPLLFDSQVVVKPWLRSKRLLNFAPHN
ncbi:cysteine proteinase inhibitor B [Argentina anserina]|uniref:cysteine proteinase inhibitor B n=1 Tax=Argentina anserina TaxID=57926 RepID=UPI002176343C|nr:cysteine proteinase inhibitor B [Potentilla anserina]